MKGTITMSISRADEYSDVDLRVEYDFDRLDAAGAVLLVWNLCEVLELGPTNRAAILRMIAAGEMDAAFRAQLREAEQDG